jgi:putative FmdB family regulatory protein
VPIYGYRCSECEEAQEHIHKFEEDPEACTGCGASPDKLVRQMSAPSFRFERSIGWDGWDRVGPGMVGREVPVEKHIDSVRDDGVAPVGAEEKNPGSRKAV